mmetsp:Transcript_39336/g.77403  ORF Transcript_39336/g.77403 Transcript_39336/m.77403 type:complete len:102 (+) Transcript_39336:267-572(+)
MHACMQSAGKKVSIRTFRMPASVHAQRGKDRKVKRKDKRTATAKSAKDQKGQREAREGSQRGLYVDRPPETLPERRVERREEERTRDLAERGRRMYTIDGK